MEFTFHFCFQSTCQNGFTIFNRTHLKNPARISLNLGLDCFLSWQNQKNQTRLFKIQIRFNFSSLQHRKILNGLSNIQYRIDRLKINSVYQINLNRIFNYYNYQSTNGRGVNVHAYQHQWFKFESQLNKKKIV